LIKNNIFPKSLIISIEAHLQIDGGRFVRIFFFNIIRSYISGNKAIVNIV